MVHILNLSSRTPESWSSAETVEPELGSSGGHWRAPLKGVLESCPSHFLVASLAGPQSETDRQPRTSTSESPSPLDIKSHFTHQWDGHRPRQALQGRLVFVFSCSCQLHKVNTPLTGEMVVSKKES